MKHLGMVLLTSGLCAGFLALPASAQLPTLKPTVQLVTQPALSWHSSTPSGTLSLPGLTQASLNFTATGGNGSVTLGFTTQRPGIIRQKVTAAGTPISQVLSPAEQAALSAGLTGGTKLTRLALEFASTRTFDHGAVFDTLVVTARDASGRSISRQVTIVLTDLVKYRGQSIWRQGTTITGNAFAFGTLNLELYDSGHKTSGTGRYRETVILPRHISTTKESCASSAGPGTQDVTVYENRTFNPDRTILWSSPSAGHYVLRGVMPFQVVNQYGTISVNVAGTAMTGGLIWANSAYAPGVRKTFCESIAGSLIPVPRSPPQLVGAVDAFVEWSLTRLPN